MSNASPQSLGARVALLRDRAGLSQSELARRLGISPQSIQQVEAGYVRRPRYVLKLARLFEVAPEWLEDGSGPPPELARPAVPSPVRRGHPAPGLAPNVASGIVSVPAPGGLPADVEVFGVAVGGRDGDFSFNGSVIDYVRRPPGVADARIVFAIYIVGDSMSPRFEDGDLVYVHKGRPARIGDDVVVELAGDGDAPGPCYVKRLLRRSASRIVLRQFNPPRDDIAIETKRIKNVYRVLTTAELLGV